jgi:hypothetical protein
MLAQGVYASPQLRYTVGVYILVLIVTSLLITVSSLCHGGSTCFIPPPWGNRNFFLNVLTYLDCLWPEMSIY